MAKDSKTEQATDHRRQKAREEGQVVRSRELSASAAMFAAVCVLVANGPANLLQWRRFYSAALDLAMREEISLATPLLPWAAQLVFDWIWKPLVTAGGVALLVALVQGGFVFAPKLLTPDIARLNPVKKVGQLFSLMTLVQLFKALIPGTALIYIGIGVFQREWPTLHLGIWASPRQLSAHMFAIIYEIFWKSCLVLLAWAAVDYIAMRQKSESDMRMSKEEIREESKQNDGNPQTRGRIRRLQRQARRQSMIKATKNATVVIVNPTHFAVALQYSDAMAAPTVIAKGQNMVALQMKEIARWDGIPIIENPPLAQSLYRTVEVGQAIPEKLYAAVAEILAYVFRLNAQAARRNS